MVVANTETAKNVYIKDYISSNLVRTKSKVESIENWQSCSIFTFQCGQKAGRSCYFFHSWETLSQSLGKSGELHSVTQWWYRYGLGISGNFWEFLEYCLSMKKLTAAAIRNRWKSNNDLLIYHLMSNIRSFYFVHSKILMCYLLNINN